MSTLSNIGDAASLARIAMNPTPLGVAGFVGGKMLGGLMGGFGSNYVDPGEVFAQKLTSATPQQLLTGKAFSPQALKKQGLLAPTSAPFQHYYNKVQDGYNASGKTAEDSAKFGGYMQNVFKTGATAPFNYSQFVGKDYYNAAPQGMPSDPMFQYAQLENMFKSGNYAMPELNSAGKAMMKVGSTTLPGTSVARNPNGTVNYQETQNLRQMNRIGGAENAVGRGGKANPSIGLNNNTSGGY